MHLPSRHIIAEIPTASAFVVACGLLAGCATPRLDTGTADPVKFVTEASATSVLGTDAEFKGSQYGDVNLAGLFPVRGPGECEVAVLEGGEDSLAVRLSTLKSARKSIRIQALIFNGDESGLRIASLLKEKKAAGLEVHVIVDGFSNLGLQTQWMYFDLKQHGIEVEGYEALALQWLNEVPLPQLVPHSDPDALDKRYHEKLWIIDGETEHGIAVMGGLNIGNEYFRAEPADADKTWRDQDVIVRGAIVSDLVTAFDRNFDYFVGVKRSRGVFDTNLYWNATRSIMQRTGRLPVHYTTNPEVAQYVAAIESRNPPRDFRAATCRFLQNRPRLRETYIQQAYVKLIERAQHEVLIANAYLVPTPSLLQALTDAAKRCASVQLISNSPETNDLPEVTLVGRGYYKRLLDVNASPEVRSCTNAGAGMHIAEWVGQAPDEARRMQGTMHSKFAVFDGQRALVGSYNLDPRSEKLNSESAIVFLEPEVAGRLRQKFLDEDLRYARQVTTERAGEFEKPANVIQRFRKSLGNAFEEHL